MFYFKERKKHPLILKNPALLIIDMQNYFLDPHSPAYLHGAERIIPNIKKIVSQAFAKEIPVVMTVHIGGNENMKNWWGNIVQENWANPFFKENKIELIKKDTYDAFWQTDLDQKLKSNNIKDIIITGVMTHLCCETTARSAFVRGYNVIMVEDALWDKDEFYHFSSLKNLAHGFATISKTEEVVWHISQLPG
ncbi:isochorismatase family protein [Thermosipho ferrireducens]|uniref:Isochorismatase family protein n=1 Tax=Thermosipho ferrireducens TaxID=2571116 RepID=A0ABX7S4U8_9BACT|nr:isochorismatase family protein [Thermosipho ferrireducens]QTA37492.1 isochorismatase family protein [Thermosipho ferrireducens]